MALPELPADAIAHLAHTIERAFPPHVAERMLSVLRELSTHWRAAVDAARRRFCWPRLRQWGWLSSALARWAALQELEVAVGCALSCSDAAALAGCRQLRRVELRRVRCDDPQRLLHAVGGLPALCRLELEPSGDGQPWTSLTALEPACAQLTALRLCELRSPDLTADVARLVAAASRLLRLELDRAVRTSAEEAQHAFDISGATQLTALTLRGSFTCDDDFAQLFARLPHLARLDISASPNLTFDGLHGISALRSSLTALVMEGCHGVTPDGGAAIASLLNLRSLRVGFSDTMCDRGVLPLMLGGRLRLTQLTRLDLSYCPKACEWPGLHHLTMLPCLHSLRVQGCRLQPGALADGGVNNPVGTLECLTGLTSLDLAQNPSIGDLARLRSLTALRRLRAWGCHLQDAHITPVLAAVPLRQLDVFANPGLTDAVLDALLAGPARTSLHWLAAADTGLTGAGLRRAVPQLAALTRLSLVCGEALQPESLVEACRAAPELLTLELGEVSARSRAELSTPREAGAGYSLLRVTPHGAA